MIFCVIFSLALPCPDLFMSMMWAEQESSGECRALLETQSFYIILKVYLLVFNSANLFEYLYSDYSGNYYEVVKSTSSILN